MLADQGATLARWKLGGKQAAPAPFDGTVRFGLITVNFSTTTYLKLMLLTLVEQRELSRISRIVLVDNDSRDGGKRFCRRLASACPKVHTVKNRFWVNHARGLRSGVAALARVEEGTPAAARSNVLLVCDTDIIFRNADTLRDLAHTLEASGAAFCGELRHGLYEYPEAQASFFALRRDAYQRPDVAPFVHHGAPAYWTQRSLWKARLPVTDFPSNRDGYILHRGRSGVAATREYRRHDAYATARNHQPHFMGVADGEAIWAAAEARHADMLIPERESALIGFLSSRLLSERDL
jgi:Glycosyl transferase family 2